MRYFRKVCGAPERAPWPRKRRPWLYHPCGGLCRGKTCYGAAYGAFKGGPGVRCLRPRLVKCPDGPSRPPWVPPPVGPISSSGHQHTSWVLGWLSECVACASGSILGPHCAMTGPRAMRGAERAHDPRHLQTRRNPTQSCRCLYVTLSHAVRVRVYAGSPGRRVAKVPVDDGFIDCGQRGVLLLS